MKTAFSFLLLASLAVNAQELEGDLLNALGDASWGSDFSSSSDVPDINSDPVDPQDQGSHTSAELNCNDTSERNTVPYKFLLGLLADKEMKVSHDPHSGILSLKGGVMIGNCNSMLDTIVSKPNESVPFYTYQVAVKRPSDCSGDKCYYDVTKIENGENKGVKGSFRPTFEGFVNCLKATGVFNNGKIQKSKIAPLEYTHQERDITKTSELVYANRGLKGARYNGRYSGNKLPEYPGCYYFEDMQKGGFKTYSVDDMETYELERLYQKVCNSGNYKLINNHISDFDQLAPFQMSLEQIRNELIMEEVKKLHEIVSEADDLSEVDTAKFKEVTSDFLEHVIKPIKNDLAQLQRLYANPGHSQKENILKSVFGPEKAKALLGKGPAELKEILKKELDIKASELVSYAREPYLTSKDFSKMTQVKSKAPLASDTWMSSVLDLYEAQSTAFHYGRYSDDFWESHYEDKPGQEGAKRYASASDLDSLISSKLLSKKQKLGRVATVAQNPGVDYAAKYENTKQTVIAGIDKEILETRQKLAQLSFKVQTQCMQEKQQKYWINQQACVRDAQEQLEACSELLKNLVPQREQVVRKYNGMIAEWNEAKKGAGGAVSDTATTASNDGKFTFKPVSPSASAQGQPGGQPNMQNQYSQYMQQMQMQMMMQQQQSMRPPWQNQGMGLNLSLNGGMGMNGMGMGMMNSPYAYRGPAYSPMYSGGMMGPMGYYGQNMSQFGGSLNFGMGGGGMLPTMGPQPYMPAYSPMAPSGGGASTGFTF